MASNPNANADGSLSIAEQMRQRAARLAAERESMSNTHSMDISQDDMDHMINLTSPEFDQVAQPHHQNSNSNAIHQNEPVSPPNHESDYEYALRLQQQFETMDTHSNTHRDQIQNPIQNPIQNQMHNRGHPDSWDSDIQMQVSENRNQNRNQNYQNRSSPSQPLPSSVAAQSQSDNSLNSEHVIDRDHEIALQLQRQFDQQDANSTSNVSSLGRNYRQNGNGNNDQNAQIPAQFGQYQRTFPSTGSTGMSFSFSSNGNGRTIHFHQSSPSNRNSNANNNGNNQNHGNLGFDDPFFQNSFGGQDPFDTPFFQMARMRSAEMHRGNNQPQNNMNPNMNHMMFGGDPMFNQLLMMNQLGGMDGMGGMQFHFGHPQPAVARQEDIDAHTQSDVYRGKEEKKQDTANSSGSVGKEEASDSEQKEEDKKDSCSICLEEFKDGDQIRRLPCFHIFHKHEIDRWLKTGNDKCPICRVPIDGNAGNQ